MTEIKMMSIREIAKTGIINECALRRLVKQDRIPYVKSGAKVLINYYGLCELLAAGL
jgi:hypothetical protein